MKLDDIRSKIQSQLYKGNDEADYSKPKTEKESTSKGKSLKDDLYRVKDLVRANREDLDEKAIRKLDYQLELYPKLNESYWLKEKLRLVYHAKDKREAHQKFFEWEQSIPNNNKTFKSIQKTINGLKKEMLAFFDGRYTNAYTESFNNQIKRIVRLGSGYAYDTLRAKILYGSEATKKVKVKDMNFYAIELVMNKKEPILWSYTEDEYYTDGVRYIDSYYTDIDELLSIIEKGDF
jgi:transposase